MAPMLAQAQDAAPESEGLTGATRVALVVGNSAYENVAPLVNPRNDAEVIAEKLWESGFEVVEAIDADREEMLASLATFRSRLRQGSEAVFFYAGHGVRIGARNYLLPTSVSPSSVTELQNQSIDAQAIVDAMNESGARLNVVILDACRNNPFAEMDEDQVARVRSRAITIGASEEAAEQGLANLADDASGGLAEMSAGETETLIGFATAPGSVALDGAGRNSPYTQSIIQHIDEPNLEIGQLFRRVRGGVRELTGGAQITWTTSTLESNFYFKPAGNDLRASTTGMGTATDTLGALPPRRVIDRAFWRAIKDTDRLDAFSAYVRTRPDGAFVEQAKQRVTELGGDPDEIIVSNTALPEAPNQAVTRGIEIQTSVADARADAVETLQRAESSLVIGAEAQTIRLSDEQSKWIFIEQAPRLGLAAADGATALQSGQVYWSDQINHVQYTPVIGSNGGVDRIEAAVLRDGGQKDAITAEVETFVHACDMLAGMPQDNKRVTAGARQFIVNRNFDAAIAACEIAVERHPEVPRFWAQLGRSYRAAGRYDDSLTWVQKAVDADYLAAIVILGQMYLDAHAVEQDYAKAYELFKYAVDKGDSSANTALAWVYRAGVGVEQNFTTAREWYLRGAQGGNDWAMTNIAELYQNGKGVDRDMNLAIAWYTQAAKSGELTAQTRLARIYQKGEGVPPDYEKARNWFETAAGRGVPNALTRLGIMYEQGQGVAKNVEAAQRLYSRAAREGDAEGVYRLGRLYASGSPLFDQPEKAITLLTLSVEDGQSGAARELAKLYEKGTGVDKDLERAIALYAKAAESNPWAARDAGRLSLETDPAEAAKWFQTSAEGGVPWAARDLAKLYESGRGVEKNRVEAVIWYATAVGLSDDPNLRQLVEEPLAKYSEQELAAAAQTMLNRLGVDVGAPDGAIGGRTTSAFSEAFTSRGKTPPSNIISLDALAQLALLK